MIHARGSLNCEHESRQEPKKKEKEKGDTVMGPWG